MDMQNIKIETGTGTGTYGFEKFDEKIDTEKEDNSNSSSSSRLERFLILKYKTYKCLTSTVLIKSIVGLIIIILILSGSYYFLINDVLYPLLYAHLWSNIPGQVYEYEDGVNSQPQPHVPSSLLKNFN